MKRFVTPVFFSSIVAIMNSQDKPAYRIFTGEGKKTDYGDMVKEVLKADVIFFGELHDNLSMIRSLHVTRICFR